MVLYTLIAAASLFAADLTGIWTGRIDEANRDPQDLSFRFTQTGGSLSGKMYTDNESLPLANLKVEGDRISFTVTTDLNGQINVFTYTGTIREGEIELTRERQAVGKKVDNPSPRPVVRLKRLT